MAALEQCEFEKVSDAQLIEIARSAEAAELMPNSALSAEEKLNRTQ